MKIQTELAVLINQKFEPAVLGNKRFEPAVLAAFVASVIQGLPLLLLLLPPKLQLLHCTMCSCNGDGSLLPSIALKKVLFLLVHVQIVNSKCTEKSSSFCKPCIARQMIQYSTVGAVAMVMAASPQASRHRVHNAGGPEVHPESTSREERVREENYLQWFRVLSGLKRVSTLNQFVQSVSSSSCCLFSVQFVFRTICLK